VSWLQLAADGGGSQGFPSAAARMASSAVVKNGKFSCSRKILENIS